MPQIKDRYSIDPYSKIPDVWILNESFQKIDLIDDYTSLIWSRRYYEVGDFELYVRVTDKNLRLLNVDLSTTVRFIMRNDTKEVMRIEKIEISTDAEEGDFITASGRDLRCLLYQRCLEYEINESTPMGYPSIGGQDYNTSLNLISIIYDMVQENIISPENDDRRIPDFSLELPTPVIHGAETQSIVIESGTNVGEKTEEICNDFRIGWRCEWTGSGIRFGCYEGRDRTSEVIFSEEFSNLIKFTDTEDLTDFYNTMILNNEFTDEDGNVATDTVTFGKSKSLLRFEKHFTGSEDLNISSKLTLRDLLYLYKIPTSYNFRWYTFTESGYDTIIHHGDSSTPNEYDIDEISGEPRTGYDYMSDDGIILITNFSIDINKGVGWKWYFNCDVYFKEYYFRIYSEEWYDTIINAVGNIGTRETIDGIDYYHITRNNDPKGVLYIGHGYVLISNRVFDGRDVGTYDFPWAFTVPAEYSEDGEAHDFDIPDGYSTSTEDNIEDRGGWIFMSYNIPLSFDLELSEIFTKDRYMAKAYSMVEEALSTNEFEGEIAPDVNYEYRKDYDIGDKIRIKTDIGIQKDVRILEAVETFDSDGYNIEVKFGV